MNPPTAVIADDEEHLRDYLCRRLAAVWPDLEIVAQAANGREALAAINEFDPDIAFLDIRMPGLSGLDVAAQLETDTRVVFITAYDQYAIEAFDRAAVDYLLKPVDDERLSRTVMRLKDSLAGDPGAAAVREAIAHLTGSEPRYLNWIKVGQSGETRIVPVDEIAFFKAEHKYTTVATAGGSMLIRRSIRELEDELDPAVFWRVHRSTLVNVRFVEVARRDLRGRFTLTLRGIPETLRVSDTYAHLFRQM